MVELKECKTGLKGLHQELSEEHPGYTYIRKPELSDTDREGWWDLYDKNFAALEENSPCRQGIPRSSFMDALDHDDITNIVIYDPNRNPVGMTMYGEIGQNTHEIFDWLSLRYFEKNYPDHLQDPEKSIQYFVTVVVDENKRDKSFMASLGSPVLADLTDRYPNGVEIVFDCCDANQGLPVALKGLCDEEIESSFPDTKTTPLERLGSQSYFMFGIVTDEQ